MNRAYSILEEEARFAEVIIRMKESAKMISKYAEARPSPNSDDEDDKRQEIHDLYSLCTGLREHHSHFEAYRWDRQHLFGSAEGAVQTRIS